MTHITATVREGRIVPDEPVELAEGAKITIGLPDGPARRVPAPPRRLTFGMLRRTDGGGRMSTEEDFKEARRSLWKDDAG